MTKNELERLEAIKKSDPAKYYYDLGKQYEEEQIAEMNRKDDEKRKAKESKEMTVKEFAALYEGRDIDAECDEIVNKMGIF